MNTHKDQSPKTLAIPTGMQATWHDRDSGIIEIPGQIRTTGQLTTAKVVVSLEKGTAILGSDLPEENQVVPLLSYLDAIGVVRLRMKASQAWQLRAAIEGLHLRMVLSDECSVDLSTKHEVIKHFATQSVGEALSRAAMRTSHQGGRFLPTWMRRLGSVLPRPKEACQLLSELQAAKAEIGSRYSNCDAPMAIHAAGLQLQAEKMLSEQLDQIWHGAASIRRSQALILVAGACPEKLAPVQRLVREQVRSALKRHGSAAILR